MKKVMKKTQPKTREQVYEFLVKYMKKNCYAPTLREICDGVYLSSPSNVYMHLLSLEAEGKIEIS